MGEPGNKGLKYSQDKEDRADSMLLPEVCDDIHCHLPNGTGDEVQRLLPD